MQFCNLLLSNHSVFFSDTSCTFKCFTELATMILVIKHCYVNGKVWLFAFKLIQFQLGYQELFCKLYRLSLSVMQTVFSHCQLHFKMCFGRLSRLYLCDKLSVKEKLVGLMYMTILLNYYAHTLINQVFAWLKTLGYCENLYTRTNLSCLNLSIVTHTFMILFCTISDFLKKASCSFFF